MSKTCIFLLIILLLSSFACRHQRQQTEDVVENWPMVHQNLARTGSYGKPAQPPLQLRWKYQTNGPIYSSPAVVKGVVYFVSNDEFCYALDAKTGNLKWKQKIELGPHYGDPSPVVANGVVYAGRGYALQADNGAVLWHNPLLGSEYPAFVVDTAVYSAVLGGSWRKVDAKTGKELLYFNTTCPFIQTTVVGNRLFTYDCNGLFCIWHTDKEIEPPRTKRPDAPVASAKMEYWLRRKGIRPPEVFTEYGMKRDCALAARKNRYIYIPGPTLYGPEGITTIDLKKIKHKSIIPSRFRLWHWTIDLKKAKDRLIEPLWEARVPFATTPVLSNDKIFTGNGPVTALDAKTGKMLWTTDIPESSAITEDGRVIKVLSTPAVAGDWIFVSAQTFVKEGYLYVLEKERGSVIEKHQISTPQRLQGSYFFRFHSSPAVVDGWVYVGSTDGCLYAFQGQ